MYAYEMTYTHPVNERSSVEMILFSPEHQEKYKEIYNDCFREMRKALDIKPYDFIQDDSFFETGMDKVYLLLNGDETIGSVALKGDEIDDLIVNRKYQGQGYGKQILLWALEHMHSEKVILHVAKWNRKAVCLYQKTGFEITNTIAIGEAET